MTEEEWHFFILPRRCIVCKAYGTVKNVEIIMWPGGSIIVHRCGHHYKAVYKKPGKKGE